MASPSKSILVSCVRHYDPLHSSSNVCFATLSSDLLPTFILRAEHFGQHLITRHEHVFIFFCVYYCTNHLTSVLLYDNTHTSPVRWDIEMQYRLKKKQNKHKNKFGKKTIYSVLLCVPAPQGHFQGQQLVSVEITNVLKS